MAYVIGAIDSLLISHYNSDAMMLLANQRLEDGVQLQWRQSGSFTSGSDETDTDFPAFLADDRLAYASTRPANAQLLWHFIFQWPTNALATLESMAIFDHNLGSSGAVIDLQIANSNDFVTDLITLVTVTPPNDNRIIELVLDNVTPAAPVNPTSYTGVQFGRLVVTASATIIPRIGELWLGEWLQFSEPVLRGFRPKKTESEFIDQRSVGGTTHRVIFYDGAGAPMPRIHLDGQVNVDAAETFLVDTQNGVLPFVLIPQPLSFPEEAMLVSDREPGDPISYIRGTIGDQAGFFDISSVVENEPFVTADV